MNSRILMAVCITILLYAIWSWWSVRSEEGFAPFDSSIEHEIIEATPVNRIVAPAGPSSPNVAPPPSAPAIQQPEESPFDPQSHPYESSELPERLRHPERLYGPGLINDETQAAVDSGIASQAASITEQNFQQFGPEFAQNGGAFLDGGVLANDTSVPTSYSSI